MRSRARRLVAAALGPALRWIRAQLEVIDRRVAAVQDGQAELSRINRAVLDAHDAEVDVVGRQLAQQRLLIESLERRQEELLVEVRELRAALPAGAPAPEPP